MFTIFGGIVTALGLATAVIAPADSTIQNVGEGALAGGVAGTIAMAAGATNPVSIATGVVVGTTVLVLEELK